MPPKSKSSSVSQTPTPSSPVPSSPIPSSPIPPSSSKDVKSSSNISLIIVVIVGVIGIIAGIATNTNLLSSLSSGNSTSNPSIVVISIELSDSQTKHDVKIDLKNYSIAATAEEFCRQRYNEGVITSIQDLATGCVPILQNFLLEKFQNDLKVDPNNILMGKYSDEVLSYHTTSSNAAADEKKTVTVPIEWGANNVVYSLDLTEPIVLFTSSEAFCRYMSDVMKVEEPNKLSFLGDCVIPVAEKIMEQLRTIYSYPESQVQRGEFSSELKAWAEEKVKERNASEKKPSLSIPVQWPENNVNYSIDLAEPILLYPAAESFCRFMLGELSIVEAEFFAFLNKCLEPVVDHLTFQLINTHNMVKENINNGDFSDELKQFFDENIKLQQQQQQQQQQPIPQVDP